MPRGLPSPVLIGPFHRGRTVGVPSAIAAVLEELWVFTQDNIDGSNNVVGLINGDLMPITGFDFATDYFPATSSATVQVPDTATYEACDGDTNNQNTAADDFWFAAGTPNDITPTDLVSLNGGNELGNTFVKYSNTSPYHIQAIGIKKDGTDLTGVDEDAIRAALDIYFSLDIYYWGYQGMGYTKENRGSEPTEVTDGLLLKVYAPEITASYKTGLVLSGFNDLSGNENHGTAAGTGDISILESDINGLDVINLTGANYFTFTEITGVKTIIMIGNEDVTRQANSPILGHGTSYHLSLIHI